MNVLVVYYSNEGSTAKVAEGLAKATGGTVRQLVDQRTAGPGSIIAALLGLGTRLVDPDYDVSDQDVVVLMTPVWAGSPTPAINTFIAHSQLRNKRVFFVCVGMSSSNARTVGVLERRLKVRGALVVGHQEVLGKAARMSSTAKGKEPRVQAEPDPTDEELIEAGSAIARTLEAALAPSTNEARS